MVLRNSLWKYIDDKFSEPTIFAVCVPWGSGETRRGKLSQGVCYLA